MRSLFILAILAVALLAVSVYRAKLGARKSEAAIDVLQSEVHGLREEVAVLRNELKHLSREKRLDEIASEKLGMGPIRPEQIVTPEELANHLQSARETGDASASPEKERQP